jgi:type II secretory pathway component GspD/PulD (secretin)
MNKIRNAILIAALSVQACAGAAETQPASAPKSGESPTNTPPQKADAVAVIVASTNGSAPTVTVGNGTQETKTTSDLGTNMLRLSFRGASLDQVLSYFSEAAGFVINVKPGTSVRGKVDVWSNEPLTREEAINLLDTVLNQNGLAAIHNGKTLTIVNKDEAKTQNIPVIQGGDPDKIPLTDKVVTQIIPVRFVEVAQLLKDLQPLVSSVNSTMTANEAGNAIVITDTQAVIHKVAEIIKAIDAGAEDFTELRVFKLTNADPNDTADLLSNLFPDDSRNGSSQSAFGGFRRLFGGRSSFGGSSFGGSSGSGSSSGDTNSRIKKRNKLIAVADQRTASVVVSASHDLMDQIAEMIQELDGNPKGRATVRVYQFQNADPQAALPILEEMFNKNGTQNNSRNNTANQNSALMNRNSTQNNQNSSSRGMTTSGSRGGGSSIGTFGQ